MHGIAEGEGCQEERLRSCNGQLERYMLVKASAIDV